MSAVVRALIARDGQEKSFTFTITDGLLSNQYRRIVVCGCRVVILEMLQSMQSSTGDKDSVVVK